jgi:hypothetical protein
MLFYPIYLPTFVEAILLNINTDTMSNIIDLLLSFSKSKGAKFVSLTYEAKSSGEIATHLINVGVSFAKAKLKDIETLKKLDVSTIKIKGISTETLEEARVTLLAAMIAPEKARSEGQKDAYTHICNGVKIHNETREIHIFGMAVSKTVIVKGTYKSVNSSNLTLAKDAIRKTLKSTKYRSFVVGNIDLVKISGETLVFA